MRQSNASHLAATHRPTAHQRAEDSTFFAAALVFIDLLALVVTSLAEKVRQGQPSQLTAAQCSASDQHAQNLTLVAFLFTYLVVFDFISLPKEMREQKAAHLAFPKHPATEQRLNRASLFTFALGFVHNLFGFHGLAPVSH
jgi:hypothetical protein